MPHASFRGNAGSMSRNKTSRTVDLKLERRGTFAYRIHGANGIQGIVVGIGSGCQEGLAAQIFIRRSFYPQHHSFIHFFNPIESGWFIVI